MKSSSAVVVEKPCATWAKVFPLAVVAICQVMTWNRAETSPVPTKNPNAHAQQLGTLLQLLIESRPIRYSPVGCRKLCVNELLETKHLLNASHAMCFGKFGCSKPGVH